LEWDEDVIEINWINSIKLEQEKIDALENNARA